MKTISEVFRQFLAEQAVRQSSRTQDKYRGIIELFESYLQSYWPGHDQKEYERVTGTGGTFCATFGPEEIINNYGEFLGYFMPRKVLCGKETLKAAGTVTKKLANWLVEKGYVKDAADAVERAGEASRDLPVAHEVEKLLYEHVVDNPPIHSSVVIEDHFWIKKVEPGRIWLEPMTESPDAIGPVPVPKRVSQLCRPGWDISGAIGQTRRGWRFLEVWTVTP
ncbi:MAG TPA: hypothetical protein VGK99_10930 [Acidobacteriota bacterium]|jgi:hypothetical protein